MNGVYEQVGGRAVVRFERALRHAPDVVWRAITDPAELAHWFPSKVEGGWTPGSVLRFEHEDGLEWQGEVKEYDEPRTVAFEWGEDLLVFELTETADGCLLRFTATMGAREKAARDAAGWHVCLDRLGAWLDAGSEVVAPGGGATPEWRALYDGYAAAGLPTGAPVLQG
jgi:uncharacterized protein YndB with AHSA1/START domain